MHLDDIESFLLKEYENIAQAFFDAREITAKWVKYYLLIIAMPFSFIAFIYKDKPEKFDILSLPDTLSMLFTLVGLIGLFLAFIIIESVTDSILYARTVNGIRKYYLDKKGDQFKEYLRQYVVLPDDIKKPSYLGFKELLWITIITALIDSFYLSVGSAQLILSNNIICIELKSLRSIIFIFILMVHFGFYFYSAVNKEKKYG